MRSPRRPSMGFSPWTLAVTAAALVLPALVSPILFQGCARPAPNPYVGEPEPLPEAFRQDPLVMLSDSTWLSVDSGPKGNRLTRRNVAWYRVMRSNPALLDRLYFYENDILQERGTIKVDAYDPDRRPWSVTGDDLKTVRPRPEGLYVEPGGSYRVVVLPRYVEGLLVRVENSDTYTRPEFLSREPLRGTFPCLRRFVSFSAPAGHGFRVGLGNREGLAVTADTAEAPGGKVEIRFSASDLPKVFPSRSPRYAEEWYAALHFSVPPKGNMSHTWIQVGDHYLDMMKDSRMGSPSLDAASAALSGKEPEASAESALKLVKSKVRYLGDFSGLNAWVPRRPLSVWENGYGDCKEMANLLRVLAAGKGVEGGLALVHTPGGSQLLEGFPALNGFNHAIFWFRRSDGSVAYLDPTMPGEMGRDSYLPVLGQKTLRIAPGASAVDTVKPGPAYRNRVTTASALAPGKGGSWELRGRIGLKGKVAQDLWLALTFQPERDMARTMVRSFLSRRFGIQAEEFSWSAPFADSLEISYSQGADAMALALDQKALKLDLPYVFRPDEDPEEQEGEWRAFAFEQSDSWTLPEGYRKLRDQGLDSAPARGKWSMAGATVRREFSMGDPAFGAGETEKRRMFRETLSRFSVATVWK